MYWDLEDKNTQTDTQIQNLSCIDSRSLVMHCTNELYITMHDEDSSKDAGMEVHDKIWMEAVSRTNQMMLIQEIDLGGRQFSTGATFIGNWCHFFQLVPLLGNIVDYDYEKKKITSKQAKFEHVFQ